MELKKERLCYSVADLPELLGVGRATAYQIVHRQDFPKVMIGKRILIPAEALQRWLEQQSGEGASA